MDNLNAKLVKTLVVRITSEQYTRLLETIILEKKKGIKSTISNVDKSKIIRQMLNKYISHPS